MFYKSTIISIAIIITLSFSSLSAQSPKAENLLKNTNNHFFIENKGQWDSQTLYLAKVRGMNIWITETGVVYDVFEIERHEKKNRDELMGFDDPFERDSVTISGRVVTMNFDGAQEFSKNISKGKRKTYYNYFIGNDSSKWARNVGLFDEVELDEIYEGVDVRYYFDEGAVRYDLDIEPGADPAKINMSFSGHDKLQVDENGSLMINTGLRPIEIKSIYAYQRSGAAENMIECGFSKISDNDVRFNVDKYNENEELIIDPLVYSTYLGGSGDDGANSLTIDNDENIYITGWTNSPDFPTKDNYQEYHGDSTWDIIVTKINSKTKDIVFSTFIGEKNSEVGRSIKLDSKNNIYITGYTTSKNFPLKNQYQEYQGHSDVFLLKLNSAGDNLIFSTCLGGEADEEANDIALDNEENVYITGFTDSQDFPLKNSFQEFEDDKCIFITKFNSEFDAFVYSTLIGADRETIGKSIAVDDSGNAYITGETYSWNFPTKNPIQENFGGGHCDLFVAKINQLGDELIFLTYLGGNRQDYNKSIALDKYGNLYITGRTASKDFPVKNKIQKHQGYYDIFVTKINTNGDSLIYSTFIGGKRWDYGNSIILDKFGNVYIAGTTSSPDFPLLKQYQDHNGTFDAYILKLNSTGDKILYSTYLGGNDEDVGTSIAIDDKYNAYLTGTSFSSNFPTKDQLYGYNGDRDCFVLKMSENPEVPPKVLGDSGVCNNKSNTYKSNNLHFYEKIWRVTGGELLSDSTASIVDIHWGDPGDGTIELVHINNDTRVRDSVTQNIRIYYFPKPEIKGDTISTKYSLKSYQTNADTNIKVDWYAKTAIFSQIESYNKIGLVWEDIGTHKVKAVHTHKYADCKDSATIEVTIKPVGVQDVYSDNNINLYIFPNPAEDNIDITIDSDDPGHYTLLIYNYQGMLVEERRWYHNKSKKFSIPLQDYHSGAYQVVVRTPWDVVSKRMVVVK